MHIIIYNIFSIIKSIFGKSLKVFFLSFSIDLRKRARLFKLQIVEKEVPVEVFFCQRGNR